MKLTDSSRVERTPDHRARLARKAELLYAKSCGAQGRGGCVEGFVIHQLRIGNEEVVADVLRFLEDRLARLGRDDPEGLRKTTEELITRVRALMSGVRS